MVAFRHHDEAEYRELSPYDQALYLLQRAAVLHVTPGVTILWAPILPILSNAQVVSLSNETKYSFHDIRPHFPEAL